MSEEVHNHTTENALAPQSCQIVLSQSTQVDPIRDLDTHTVATYLESLCKEARKGNSESAKEFFILALWATHQLKGIVEKHPKILRGVSSADVPVILGQNGIQTKKDITALATKFRVTWARKMKKKANPKIRELAEEVASELNKRRLQAADDNPSAPDVPPSETVSFVSEVLSVNGRKEGDHGTLWQGWEAAAKFLPAPSKGSAYIWWKVAEVHLRERFPTEAGKWFEHPQIFHLTGKSESAGKIDTDKARGSMKKGIRDRFFEAVERLQAHTP